MFKPCKWPAKNCPSTGKTGRFSGGVTPIEWLNSKVSTVAVFLHLGMGPRARLAVVSRTAAAEMCKFVWVVWVVYYWVGCCLGCCSTYCCFWIFFLWIPNSKCKRPREPREWWPTAVPVLCLDGSWETLFQHASLKLEVFANLSGILWPEDGLTASFLATYICYMLVGTCSLFLLNFA